MHASPHARPQLDPAIGVRKWLSGFLGEACSRRPLPAILSMAAGCLGALTQDAAPGVVKLALLSCVHLVRGALGALAQQVGMRAGDGSIRLLARTSLNLISSATLPITSYRSTPYPERSLGGPCLICVKPLPDLCEPLSI